MGPLNEVHTRRTTENEYRFKIEYSDDLRTSRLHPTRRVSLVGIELNHPEPLSSVLKEMPEIYELCNDACKAQTFREGLLIAIIGRIPGALCLSNPGRGENICLSFTDATGHFKNVEKMTDLVSIILIRPYSDLRNEFGSTVKNLGVWQITPP